MNRAMPFAFESGQAVMMLLKNKSARAISSRARRWKTLLPSSAATGGSTNGALHLPAIAHGMRHRFRYSCRGQNLQKTPYLADLMPGGKYTAKDLYEAGGVEAVMRTLLDGGFLHGDCLTVTGKTIKENLRDVPPPGRGRIKEGVKMDPIPTFPLQGKEIRPLFTLQQPHNQNGASLCSRATWRPKAPSSKLPA